MGPATLRRFALVATVLLLAPAWCRPSVADLASHETSPVLVRIAQSGASGISTISRPAAAVWRTAGARLDHGRILMAVGLLGLLSLIALAPWANLRALLAAPSSLGRLGHVISLRAPPLLLAH